MERANLALYACQVKAAERSVANSEMRTKVAQDQLDLSLSASRRTPTIPSLLRSVCSRTHICYPAGRSWMRIVPTVELVCRRRPERSRKQVPTTLARARRVTHTARRVLSFERA
ncbi:hypothetical protein PR003_g6339 [Phytophthora rubi]|uniref:Uncharacterized protein n=1 Tax=Phytophthora rubi TaxID=129364 RepID=A0A6A4FX60_9STRA|nr:hypothetical protein PR001_g6008 [Phytophthora rubi]KAE9348576.1 hypothetical protein PR003_g6339 [Phytophthora rubi]